VRRLLVVAVVLALAPAARAAAPPVTASAYLIEDARTGEVLAASNQHERVPIASITKLMTVLVTLQHHKLTDVVRVDPRAAAVGESTIDLGPHERITVHDLIEGALIQSANDAADALALSVAPSFPSFARLMNAEAARLGLHDTHFVRPDGLDAAGEYSSAADVTKLARTLMHTRFIRRTVNRQTATISRGRSLHTWNDLLALYGPTMGVQTGHTGAAGWCEVAAARGRGVTVYATLLGSPTRSRRNGDLESLLVWALGQFRVVPVVQAVRDYAEVRMPYGIAPLQLVAERPLLAVARVGRPLVERVVAPVSASLPIERGQALGRVQIWDGKRLVGSRALVASRPVRAAGLRRRVGWYLGKAFHHLVHLL
jgi:serine-type D-Ala-D-Ala carboxypeptidase (penicillin-binding protein 5/6)